MMGQRRGGMGRGGGTGRGWGCDGREEGRDGERGRKGAVME